MLTQINGESKLNARGDYRCSKMDAAIQAEVDDDDLSYASSVSSQTDNNVDEGSQA